MKAEPSENKVMRHHLPRYLTGNPFLKGSPGDQDNNTRLVGFMTYTSKIIVTESTVYSVKCNLAFIKLTERNIIR